MLILRAATWGLSFGDAQHYGWRWCLHLGPVIFWIGWSQEALCEQQHNDVTK
jgi:hypothetical protein